MFENNYFTEMKVAMNDTIRSIEKSVDRGISFSDYMVNRTALNVLIVNAVTGSELTVTGSEAKCKFNKRLPSFAQVGEIVDILDTFIEECENPFLVSVEEMIIEKREAENDKDDMGIPVKPKHVVDFSSYYRGVPLIKHPSNKELKKIFSGGRNFINGLIKPHDIYVLYHIGKQARSNANFKKGVIIGGILTVVACTAAGVVMFKKKKDGEELNDGTTENAALGLRSELSDIDIPTLEYKETNIPVISDSEVKTEVPTYNVELNAL